MVTLADAIGFQVHRLVTDNTGLTGRYDLTLDWQSDDSAGPATHDNGPDAKPSLFTALQEQLGLKLEPTKGPVDTLVIDHVEMPSEN